MDLIATLRSKISSLEEGEYTPGLKATILHIETALYTTKKRGGLTA